MGIIREFKDFAIRGNVVDMAVGVIIGGAFGKVVSSVVADLIMPPLGLLLGGVNLKELNVILKQASVDAAGKAIPAISLNYGNFLQNVFDFLIIAFFIFLFIKAINRMKKKEEAPAPAGPTKEEILLTEIRDLLKIQGKY